MLQKIRRNAFWALDRLKGSGVKNHLEEVAELMEVKPASETRALNDRYLRDLLVHSVETVPFYHSFSRESSFTEFPVIDKDVIRTNYSDFRSGQYSDDEVIPAITSGSTGTPFKVFHDRNKKLRNSADTLYFAGLAGYEIGQKLIYLKIWVEEKMAPPLYYKMQNMIPVDVIKLSDEVIEELIQRIESEKTNYSILGYVSALEQICKYLEKKGVERVDAEVASIITMSESLTEYVKEKMEDFFGAPVYGRYSNLENGILAQQVPGSDGKYLINQASYKIEVLNFDDDYPAPPGVPGRIVVTDLFSYAMPMIRYDTGDVGTLSGSDLNGKAYFDKIEGRKLDVLYDTSGNIVSSYIMYKNMWQYTEIKQYQLIQEGEKKYRFKINADTVFKKEKKLVEEFKLHLGSDADFVVEYVDEIPLLASGKRKKTLNTWKN